MFYSVCRNFSIGLTTNEMWHLLVILFCFSGRSESKCTTLVQCCCRLLFSPKNHFYKNLFLDYIARVPSLYIFALFVITDCAAVLVHRQDREDTGEADLYQSVTGVCCIVLVKMSTLDWVWRWFILTKFYSKGWGRPTDIKRYKCCFILLGKIFMEKYPIKIKTSLEFLLHLGLLSTVWMSKKFSLQVIQNIRWKVWPCLNVQL